MTQAVLQALSSKIKATSMRTMKDLMVTLEARLFQDSPEVHNYYVVHDRQDWIKLLIRLSADPTGEINTGRRLPAPGSFLAIFGCRLVIIPERIVKGSVTAASIHESELPRAL